MRTAAPLPLVCAWLCRLLPCVLTGPGAACCIIGSVRVLQKLFKDMVAEKAQ